MIMKMFAEDQTLTNRPTFAPRFGEDKSGINLGIVVRSPTWSKYFFLYRFSHHFPSLVILIEQSKFMTPEIMKKQYLHLKR